MPARLCRAGISLGDKVKYKLCLSYMYNIGNLQQGFEAKAEHAQ
jgi:hypothetical protein